MMRGYSIVEDTNGKLVKTINALKTGDDVSVRLSDGSVIAEVKEVRHE